MFLRHFNLQTSGSNALTYSSKYTCIKHFKN